MIDLFVWAVEKCVVEKPLNPKCGLRVECVGNRHENKKPVNPKCGLRVECVGNRHDNTV